MAYTVTKLITNAFYTSGVIARKLQTVSGDQLSDGLDLFNDLLSIHSVERRLIPYYTRYQFTAVIGQESYLIPNLLSVDALTFNIGPIRFPMIEIPRDEYFGSGRANNITSLPYSYHVEREYSGARIFLYFLPAAAYQLNLIGKFGLSEATLNQDLSLIYDRDYIVYLKYALADYICADFGVQMQLEAAQELARLKKSYKDISPIDLSMKKMSTLNRQSTYNYAFINLSGGWGVPS